MGNEIFAALSQYGFTPVNDAVCVGTWRNYAVSLQKISGKMYYIYVAIRLQKVPSDLKKTLNAFIKQPGVKLGGVEQIKPNYLQFSISFARAENPAAHFAERMELLTATLAQNGVFPANTCAITGAPNPDSLCLLFRNDCCGYQPVCAAAVRQEDYTLQEKTEENENNGSYATGFIGALLGALVGIAVNVLVMVFLHFISAWLFALIPILAFVGYKKLNGKTDKVSVLIVIAVSILSLPVMVILELAFEVIKEYKAPFGEALRFGMESVVNPDVLSAMAKDLILMVVFMAIGIFAGWSFMRGQLNSTKLQSSKDKLDSLRPNPNYQLQQTVEAPQQ